MFRRFVVVRLVYSALTVLLIVFMASPCFAENAVVVVNKDVPDSSLDAESLQRIYLGKKTRWSGGKKIVPVMLKSGSTHEVFVEKFLNKAVSQFNTYWKQAVFTGKGIPPKTFENENDLMEYVSETPGAIGYISTRKKVLGVKIILIE